MSRTFRRNRSKLSSETEKTTVQRLPVRATHRRNTAVVLSGAALAAAAVLGGVAAPAASAAALGDDCGLRGNQKCVSYPVLASGPLFGLLTGLVNVMDANPVTVSKALNVAWNLNFRSSEPGRVYKFIDDTPYGLSQKQGTQCGYADSTTYCRQIEVLAVGLGVLGVAEAEKALWSAAEGGTLTPPGGTPSGPNVVPSASGLTVLSSLLLNNPLTPDGGIATRFAPIFKALGFDTAMPPSGFVDSLNPTGSSFSNSVMSVAWPYNPLADFPVTLNPFALANSFLASIPPIAHLGDQLAWATSSDPLYGLWQNAAGSSIASEYDLFLGGPPTVMNQDVSYTGGDMAGSSFLGFLGGDPNEFWNPNYLTLAATNCKPGSAKCVQNTALPILYPTELAGLIVNPLLRKVKSPYLLGNPLADILTPALRILVNIGYNDVITPAKLTEVDPLSLEQRTYQEEGYSVWDRQFVQTDPENPTPFGWFKNPAMTGEDTRHAYGDAFKAFVGALKTQAAKPMLGILVKNPADTTAATPATAAAVTARATAASQTVAPEMKAVRSTSPSASIRAGHNNGGQNTPSGHVRGSRIAK